MYDHKKTSLFSSPLIKKAVYFAAEKHDGQYRKGSRVPYFAHPVLVAFGVLEYSKDQHVIAAAILHDILENCPQVTLGELKKIFGNKVARIVEEVSLSVNKAKKKKGWKNKKELYLNKIKNASKEALLVVAIDKISNMRAYFESAMARGKNDLTKLFGGTLEDYFWYYGKISAVLESKLGNHSIVKEYKKTLLYYQIQLAYSLTKS